MKGQYLLQDPQAYSETVKKINAICTINKQNAGDDINDLPTLMSRKVSLSCEPSFMPPPVSVEASLGGRRIRSPIPSPIPSPSSSPGPRSSRFHVIKVQDTSPTMLPTTGTSRFRVSPVSDRSLAQSSPAEEDVEVHQFLNVRSSLSSNDSVESLLPRDSDSVLTPTDVSDWLTKYCRLV